MQKEQPWLTTAPEPFIHPDDNVLILHRSAPTALHSFDDANHSLFLDNNNNNVFDSSDHILFEPHIGTSEFSVYYTDFSWVTPLSDSNYSIGIHTSF